MPSTEFCPGAPRIARPWRGWFELRVQGCGPQSQCYCVAPCIQGRGVGSSPRLQIQESVQAFGFSDEGSRFGLGLIGVWSEVRGFEFWGVLGSSIRV